MSTETDTGSPPRARGVDLLLLGALAALGITPAGAGSGQNSSFGSTPSRDHPRGRGEWSSRAHQTPPPGGSPPRARGVGGPRRGQVRRSGITPAGAGSGQGNGSKPVAGGDHPRGRGEWNEAWTNLSRSGGSPPRARGVEDALPGHPRKRRITPAGAGSGGEGLVHSVASRDHPRGRGEWSRSRSPSPPEWGSPPRARGVEPAGPENSFMRGITPAGAGSGLR